MADQADPTTTTARAGPAATAARRRVRDPATTPTGDDRRDIPDRRGRSPATTISTGGRLDLRPHHPPTKTGPPGQTAMGNLGPLDPDRAPGEDLSAVGSRQPDLGTYLWRSPDGLSPSPPTKAPSCSATATGPTRSGPAGTRSESDEVTRPFQDQRGIASPSGTSSPTREKRYIVVVSPTRSSRAGCARCWSTSPTSSRAASKHATRGGSSRRARRCRCGSGPPPSRRRLFCVEPRPTQRLAPVRRQASCGRRRTHGGRRVRRPHRP